MSSLLTTFSVAVCLVAIASGAELFYGNAIEQRPDQQISYPRVWMDFNTTLGWGHLRKLVIYTIDLDEIPDQPVFVRLQLWKPYTRQDFQFGLLIWEMRIEVAEFGTRLEIPVSDEVQILETYVLGLTNEGAVNPVSCTEVHGQKRAVYYRRIHLNNREKFPQIGQESYVFNKITDYFPVIFSIGAVIENEPFLDESESGVFHGNVIRPRKWTLKSGARKTWLDSNIELEQGYVKEFLVQVQEADPNQPLTLRFQIWKQKGENEYQLEWEKICTFHGLSNGLRQMKVPADEAPAVSPQHKVGWTYESDHGPIAYDFRDTHRTKVLIVEGDEFPVVGQSYAFDIDLPYRFSFGVIVTSDNNWKNDDERDDNGAHAGVTRGDDNGANAGVTRGDDNGANAGVTRGDDNSANAGVTRGDDNSANAGVTRGDDNGANAGVTRGDDNSANAGVTRGDDNGVHSGVPRAQHLRWFHPILIWTLVTLLNAILSS